MSHIDYCLVIWASISDTHIKVLQSKINSILGSYFYPQIINRYQRISKIAQTYSNSKIKCFNIDYLELHEKCNILTVHERIAYFDALLAFKSMKSNSIPQMKEFFKFGQSLRNQSLIVPTHNTKFFEKSPIYMSIMTWNTLCSEAKQPDLSLPKFIKTINEWLLSKRLEEFVSA